MSEALWKKTERRVAAIFGGKRIPITGRQRGDVPDVAHPWLSIEVKTRRALPAWLREAMAQAVAAAQPDQLPVVVLHEVGDRHADDLVLLRLSDFKAWFGGGDRQCQAVAEQTHERRS